MQQQTSGTKHKHNSEKCDKSYRNRKYNSFSVFNPISAEAPQFKEFKG